MIGQTVQINKYQDIRGLFYLLKNEEKTSYRVNIQVSNEFEARRTFDFLIKEVFSQDSIVERLDFQCIDIFIDSDDDYRVKFGNIFFEKNEAKRILKKNYQNTRFNFIITNKEYYVYFLKLFNENIYPELSKHLVTKIFISQKIDFKIKFGNIFCERKSFHNNVVVQQLKEEFQNCRFLFDIDNSLSQQQKCDLWDLYIKLFNEKDYPNVASAFYLDNQDVNIFVMEQKSIKKNFFDVFCDKEQGRIVLKKIYSKLTFNFILSQNYIEEGLSNILQFINNKQCILNQARIIIKILMHFHDLDSVSVLSHFNEQFAERLKVITTKKNIETIVECSITAPEEIEEVFCELNRLMYQFHKNNSTCHLPFKFHIHETNYNDISYVMIFNQRDYQRVFDRLQIALRNDDLTEIFLKNEYEKIKKYVFFIGMNDENLDLFLLHNFVVFYNALINKCQLELRIFRPCANIQDEFRIRTFLSCLDDKTKVYLNKHIVESKVRGYRKLLPAFSVKTEEEYKFLASPIDNWKMLLDEPEKCLAHQPYGYLLNACNNYINNLGEVESSAYKRLRLKAYNSSKIQDIIKTVPFLALLIFFMYDSFYRSDNLSQFKSFLDDKFKKPEDNPFRKNKKKEYRWNEFDFVSDILQPYDRYCLYDEFRKKGIDLKNILDARSGGIKPHPTMITMFFESISIAEGLLQIIENSIKHASGCTISCRLYSREDYKHYLSNTYGEEYLNYIHLLNGGNNITSQYKTQYYLETEITDLSKYSIPNKFKSNFLRRYSNDKKSLDDIQLKDVEQIKKVFDCLELKKSEWLKLPYFYGEKTEAELEFSKKYYSVPHNLVRHYGLEIFTNIVTARKGIFSVCGHGDKYNNLLGVANEIFINPNLSFNGSEAIREMLISEINNKLKAAREEFIFHAENNISSNVFLPGTTYRILLPINYSSISQSISESSIGTIVESSLGAVEDKLNYTKYEARSKQSYFCVREIVKDVDFDSEHGAAIKAIANKIKISPNTKIVFFDFLNFKPKSTDRIDFETVIKAIILTVLEFCKYTMNGKLLEPLAVALVNVDSIQLIDASRLLAIYYAKEKEKEDEMFSRFQVYLKTTDENNNNFDDVNIEGFKEVFFVGQNIDEVRENILKSAMTNGSMSSEIETIIHILEMHKNG